MSSTIAIKEIEDFITENLTWRPEEEWLKKNKLSYDEWKESVKHEIEFGYYLSECGGLYDGWRFDRATIYRHYKSGYKEIVGQLQFYGRTWNGEIMVSLDEKRRERIIVDNSILSPRFEYFDIQYYSKGTNEKLSKLVSNKKIVGQIKALYLDWIGDIKDFNIYKIVGDTVEFNDGTRTCYEGPDLRYCTSISRNCGTYMGNRNFKNYILPKTGDYIELRGLSEDKSIAACEKLYELYNIDREYATPFICYFDRMVEDGYLDDRREECRGIYLTDKVKDLI